METSESIDKLAPALCKAQETMGGAVKDSDNPFFSSKYADLTSVWKACKESLHANGFSVIQSPISKDGRIGVATMLLHTSGQYIKDEFTLGVKKQNDPQADGSSITYARRYALAAFVGVCPVDDDAEAAMKRNESYTDYIEEVDACKSADELRSWWKSNASRINKLKKADKDKLAGYVKDLGEFMKAAENEATNPE